MATNMRNRFNRFKPRSEIEWLTHEERSHFRTNVKIMLDLVTKLSENPDEITSDERQLLMTLAEGSSSRDTQLNAAMTTYEQTQHKYTMKLAAMAPHDLSAYHEMMNPHEPPAYHHQFLCDKLMAVEAGKIRTLLISMPPGSAKSTYGSRSFAQWYMGRNPDKRVLAVSHGQQFGENEFSKPNRNAVDSEEYNLAFPDVRVSETESAAGFWRLEDWRGSYTMRGAGAGVAGIRANIILGDDPIKNDKDAMSNVIMESLWRWWVVDLLSRGLPNCPQVLIATRWRDIDIIGRLEALFKEDPTSINGGAEGKVEIINIPALAGENDLLGRPAGQWLWEDYYGKEHYETKKASMPPSMWSALYMGIPLDAQGDYVGEDEFQRYEKYPRNLPDEPIQWTRTIMSVDCAAKGDERSDNSVILVFRLGVDKIWYMIDCYAGKPKMDELMTRMSRMMKTHDVKVCLVEESGMGLTILENHATAFPAPLQKYTPSGKGSKAFRFDNAAPWIKTGRILFPPQDKAKWMTDFINELVAFPNGENDDRVDAFSQFVDYFGKTRKGGSKKLVARGM